MPLNDTAIRQAKPGSRPIKLFDGGGMFLLLSPSGSRWWRFKYRVDGSEKLLSLGVYPDVSLKLARERRDEARRLLATGVDPCAKRQAEKLSRADTFEAIAREWLALQAKPDARNKRPALAAATLDKAVWMFEKLMFPYLGARPISKITVPELLKVLRRIEVRGKHETCHRTKQRCGQVFRYAIATGRAERDITADLRGALAPIVSRNRAAITDPNRIGELLRAIDGYRGQRTTEFALKLAPLVFVRPLELRAAEWSEFDLNRAEWRISAERMKMGEEHVVPLSRQALEILRDVQPLTGDGRYVFPSLRSHSRPMSNNAITAALRRMGYGSDEMTWHGFRSLASTCLNEQGWHPDLIELQLAHADRNKVRAAYNRAQRLQERRRMMQTWADYLDGLRASTKVTSIGQAA
jgi:integrase